MTVLLSIPFRDLICKRASVMEQGLFTKALASRPELSTINWHVDNSARLAEQLWQFQSDVSDRKYHTQLSVAFKWLMQYHDIDPEKIAEVHGIISERTRTRGKRLHEMKRNARDETVTKQAERLARKRLLNTRKFQDKKAGLNLALLKYIQFEDPFQASAEELYEEALKYRCKYRSAKSFLASLRYMWKVLGYTDAQVFHLNHDKRSKQYPTWEKPGKGVENVEPQDEIVQLSAEGTAEAQLATTSRTYEIQDVDPCSSYTMSDGQEMPTQSSSLTPLHDFTVEDSADQQSLHADPYSFQDDDHLYFSQYYDTQVSEDINDDVVFPSWDSNV